MKSKVQPNKVGTYNAQPYKGPDIAEKVNWKRVDRYFRARGVSLDEADNNTRMDILDNAPRHIREIVFG